MRCRGAGVVCAFAGQGVVNSRVRPRGGFQENAHKFDDPATVGQLETAIQTVVTLAQRLRVVDSEMLKTDLYLRKSLMGAAGPEAVDADRIADAMGDFPM